jgi:hypothetical protein
MEVTVDQEMLKDDLFYLTGYMLTSASNLYDEPAEYGVFRLVDATERLLAIMAAHGLMDDYLMHLRGELREEKAGSMDSARQKATIHRMVMEYTSELQRRLVNE